MYSFTLSTSHNRKRETFRFILISTIIFESLHSISVTLRSLWRYSTNVIFITLLHYKIIGYTAFPYLWTEVYITAKNASGTLVVYTSSTIDRLEKGLEGGNGSVAAVGGGWTPRYFICHWNWNELEGELAGWRWFSARTGNANADLTKRSMVTARLWPARFLNRPVSSGLCVIKTRVAPDRHRESLCRVAFSQPTTLEIIFRGFLSNRLYAWPDLSRRGSFSAALPLWIG